MFIATCHPVSETSLSHYKSESPDCDDKRYAPSWLSCLATCLCKRDGGRGRTISSLCSRLRREVSVLEMDLGKKLQNNRATKAGCFTREPDELGCFSPLL